MFELESQIRKWRDHLRATGTGGHRTWKSWSPTCGAVWKRRAPYPGVPEKRGGVLAALGGDIPDLEALALAFVRSCRRGGVRRGRASGQPLPLPGPAPHRGAHRRASAHRAAGQPAAPGNRIRPLSRRTAPVSGDRRPADALSPRLCRLGRLRGDRVPADLRVHMAATILPS